MEWRVLEVNIVGIHCVFVHTYLSTHVFNFIFGMRGFSFFFVLGIPKAAKEVDSLSFPDILGL